MTHSPEQIKAVAERLGKDATIMGNGVYLGRLIDNQPMYAFIPTAPEHIMAMHFMMTEYYQCSLAMSRGYIIYENDPRDRDRLKGQGKTPEEAILDAFIQFIENK